MRQRLHLLIVDREHRAALAARYGTRWLIPQIDCEERVRAGPLAARWCAGRGLAGDIAGQWLGRIDDAGIDWLIAICARQPALPSAASLEWIALDSMANGASVVDYQSWALSRSLARVGMPAVDGPFGTLEWPDRVRTWITAVWGSAVPSWTPYRTSAREVVLGVETARGRVYFKGLSGARACEALVTRTLAALMPRSFAPTLALERCSDGTAWWLTGECRGRPSNDASIAGAALARVQQQLMPRRALRTLAHMDLEKAADWAGERCGSPLQADLIRRAFHYTRHADLPRSWIPMDLDPSNVLVDGGDVRFIDVEDSFAGPAPLPMALLTTRCRGPSAYRAYEQSWPPPLERVDWQRLEIAATVVQAWLGWERFVRNVERGEVCAALDRIELIVRERLAGSFYRR